MYTKTIAITGASGFIGSNLSRHLKIDFNVIEINIRDYKEVRELTNFLEKNKITHFINCIGGKSVGFSLKNPLFDFESNVSVGVFILHAISAVKFNIHFSHISSAGIYGEQNELFNEHFIFSPYATHKKIFEFSIQSLLKNNFLIIRPFSVYGTGLKKQILFDAYKKFNKEKNVVFYGTGNEIRNFIYIDDLCEIIHKHLLNNITGIIDIGSREQITIKQLLTHYSEVLRIENNFSFNGIFDNGNPQNLSIIKNKLLIEHHSYTSLNDGLKKYSEWIRKFFSN